MDFSFTEEQDAVRDLARQILDDRISNDALRAIEQTDERFDRDTWKKFADAGLLALPVPEEHSGSGLGLVEIALVAEQVARTNAYLPVLSTLVSALAIAEHGSEAQQASLLPGVADGSIVVGLGLAGADGFVIGGVEADRALVERDGRLELFDLAGVRRERQDTTSGVPEARLDLGGATGEPVGDAGLAEWLRERATAVVAVMMAAVCDRAVRMTADYTKERTQFDRAIATFQAVGQRAADAYIDTEAIRLTAWQAVWRLASGLPAAKEVAIAKFWAADGGQRVVHAAQHLHGGIGVDRDYPLHRCFLWAKHLELMLGGATPQLLRLGELLAAEPV